MIRHLLIAYALCGLGSVAFYARNIDNATLEARSAQFKVSVLAYFLLSSIVAFATWPQIVYHVYKLHRGEN